MAQPAAADDPAAARTAQAIRRRGDILSGTICRTFSLWCRHGFADEDFWNDGDARASWCKPRMRFPGDPPTASNRVYLIEISVATGAPVMHMTFIPAGGGNP